MPTMRELMALVEASATIQNGLFYHCTPSRNVASIREHGLRPTEKGVWGHTYPEPRVYLLQDGRDAYELAKHLIEDRGSGPITVFTVDLRGQDLGFEVDPDWGIEPNSRVTHPAVFIKQGIPASQLSCSIVYTAEDVADEDDGWSLLS